MKIFSMIKNYFKNIKTKKKLKVFKKYLSKLEEAFLNLQLIEEPFDYIRKHYNEIKLNDNNLIYINKFDELTSKIGSHNQLIDKINLFVESFSFNESITKINVMSQEEIDELLKTVEFINGF